MLAGAVAAISGFGIGSLLTPLLAGRYGTKLAVASVSIPHVVATAARLVRLREHVDKRVFINFGILSAAGGLLGALLNLRANSPVLSIVFGCLLLFAGISGLTRMADRMRFGRRMAWTAGAFSGLFGGLVGNPGGIRLAALLGFEIPKESLVAMATAVALIVDGARMPVYLAIETRQILNAWGLLLLMIPGVLLGTWWGVRLLRRIPDRMFRPLLDSPILTLGVYMLLHAIKLQRHQ